MKFQFLFFEMNGFFFFFAQLFSKIFFVRLDTRLHLKRDAHKFRPLGSGLSETEEERAIREDFVINVCFHNSLFFTSA